MSTQIMFFWNALSTCGYAAQSTLVMIESHSNSWGDVFRLHERVCCAGIGITLKLLAMPLWFISMLTCFSLFVLKAGFALNDGALSSCCSRAQPFQKRCLSVWCVSAFCKLPKSIWILDSVVFWLKEYVTVAGHRFFFA